MSAARVAQEQRVAWKGAGRARADDRQPLHTDVPFGAWQELADEDQAAVGVLRLRSGFFDLDDEAASERAVVVDGSQLAHSRSPRGLEVAAPDQTMRPHVEDVGKVGLDADLEHEPNRMHGVIR